MTVGAIVLAAGASRRAGGPKALSTIDGGALVLRAAQVVRQGGATEVVVVVGPPHRDRVAAAAGEAVIVDNPDPSRGMLSSLQVGLVRAAHEGWDAAVVALVDHPRVTARTVHELVARCEATRADVVYPVRDGRRGHPVVIGCRAFSAVLGASDEATVRDVLAALPHHEEVAVDDAGVLDDLDTAEELRAAGAVPASD